MERNCTRKACFYEPSQVPKVSQHEGLAKYVMVQAASFIKRKDGKCSMDFIHVMGVLLLYHLWAAAQNRLGCIKRCFLKQAHEYAIEDVSN